MSEKKMNRWKTAWRRSRQCICFALVLLCLILPVLSQALGVTAQASEKKTSEKQTTEDKSSETNNTKTGSQETVLFTTPSREWGTLEVTMLDVGQSLAILIHADDHYLLYDGGDREHSSYVVSYLQQHEITELDYVIASHYDEDHIAGLIGVLNTTNVHKFLRPDYETDTDIYRSLEKKVEEKKCVCENPLPGYLYRLGDARIRVLSPKEYGTNENDNSLAVRITYGEFSVLITGDAEGISEEMMLESGYDLKSDLYVAGHHGSGTSSSEAFLKEVQPTVTFLSCGKDNSYGHPDADTMLRLKNTGTKLFRSDLQGEVTATYDGTKKELTFSTDFSTDFSSGAEISAQLAAAEAARLAEQQKNSSTAVNQSQSAGNNSSSSDSGGVTYILNTNSKKFHYPNCKSAANIKSWNRQESSASRETLINQGYSPCGNCHP